MRQQWGLLKSDCPTVTLHPLTIIFVPKSLDKHTKYFYHFKYFINLYLSAEVCNRYIEIMYK